MELKAIAPFCSLLGSLSPHAQGSGIPSHSLLISEAVKENGKLGTLFTCQVMLTSEADLQVRWISLEQDGTSPGLGQGGRVQMEYREDPPENREEAHGGLENSRAFVILTPSHPSASLQHPPPPGPALHGSSLSSHHANAATKNMAHMVTQDGVPTLQVSETKGGDSPETIFRLTVKAVGKGGKYLSSLSDSSSAMSLERLHSIPYNHIIFHHTLGF